MATGSEFAAALRQIADWYDDHPEMPGATEINITTPRNTPEVAAGIVRALGSCSKDFSKDVVAIARDFGGCTLRFVLWRSAVCERRVVGTREVPERVTPAHVEEIIEWDCHPILAAEEPEAVVVIERVTA